MHGVPAQERLRDVPGERRARDAAIPRAPVEFLCHVAHLRARVLGWPFPEHGECEFCPGGTKRGDVEREAEALKARGGTPPPARKTVPLRVLRGAAPSAGGCGGGCGRVAPPMGEGR